MPFRLTKAGVHVQTKACWGRRGEKRGGTLGSCRGKILGPISHPPERKKVAERGAFANKTNVPVVFNERREGR